MFNTKEWITIDEATLVVGERFLPFSHYRTNCSMVQGKAVAFSPPSLKGWEKSGKQGAASTKERIPEAE